MIRESNALGDLEFCKPRASGDDPFTPQTDSDNANVNPARAGMIPAGLPSPLTHLCKPRASGDDPRPLVLHRERPW